jgi:hypothetical protein
MAFTIASLITAIVSFSLGIFVYLKNTKSAVNKSWFILSLSVSIWSFGIFALHNSPDEAHALFWIRFMYCGAIFIPSSFLHLIFNVSGITRYARNKKIILATYIISIIFLILNFTPLFVKGVKPRLDFKYFTDPGILLPVYGLFYLSDLIYAFYKLITEFPRVSAVKRNQLKYILFAAIVGFGGGLSTFLPLANIKIFPFGYYVTPFYSVIVSYAIVKHRLMDIDIVIKKGAVYAYLASLIFVPCVLIIFFAQKFFFGYTNLVS